MYDRAIELIAALTVYGFWARVIAGFLFAGIIGAVLVGPLPNLAQQLRDSRKAASPTIEDRKIIIQQQGTYNVQQSGTGNTVIVNPTPLQKPSHEFAGLGFLQPEKTSLVVPEDFILKPGIKVGLYFLYKNRGSLPVYDAQAWAMPIVAETARNPDQQIMDVWKKGIIDAYGRFAGKGSNLGINQETLNTGWSDQTLTEEKISGLVSGSYSMFLLTAAAWRDSRDGEPKYWFSCDALDKLPPDRNVRGVLWRHCQAN